MACKLVMQVKKNSTLLLSYKQLTLNQNSSVQLMVVNEMNFPHWRSCCSWWPLFAPQVRLFTRVRLEEANRRMLIYAADDRLLMEASLGVSFPQDLHPYRQDSVDLNVCSRIIYASLLVQGSNNWVNYRGVWSEWKSRFTGGIYCSVDWLKNKDKRRKWYPSRIFIESILLNALTRIHKERVCYWIKYVMCIKLADCQRSL